MLARNVARYAGITYRQLDSWTRESYLVLHAPGSGHERNYPDQEARVAWWMARLIEAGFTVRSAADIARRLTFIGAKHGRVNLRATAPERAVLDVSALAPPPTSAYS